MGLLEKLKNTFFEEEYVEVEEPVKPEKVARKIEVNEIKKEKKVKEKEKKEEEILDEEENMLEEAEEPKVENYSDRELVNKNSKIAYFDEEDFEPVQHKHKAVEPKEEKKIYGETTSSIHDSINLDDMDKYKYKSHTAYGATETKFQPTPIISPIYGVLDKNYRKEEVIDKKDKPSSYVSRKNADLDSVRRKAYGSASSFFMDDPEEEEKVEPVVEPRPLLYDMIEEPKPVVGDVTVGDAEEYFNDLGLEYNVDYKDQKYETATGRRSTIYRDDADLDEVIINNENDNDDDDTLDDFINRNKSSYDDESANLEDNLFDLVDSMYEGGE